MKKIVLAFIVFLQITSGSANFFANKKIKILFDQQQYDKCIETAKLSLSKESVKSNAEPYLYLALSYYQKSMLTGKQTFDANLKEALYFAQMAKLKDTKKEYRQKSEKLIATITAIARPEMLLKQIPKLEVKLNNLEKYRTQLYKTKSRKHRLLEENDVNVDSIYFVHGWINDSLNPIRCQLIINAEKLLGTRYRRGGKSIKALDCSGFVQYSYSSVGIELPGGSYTQSVLGDTVSLQNVKPGDLIFFGYTHKKKKGYRTKHVSMVYSNHDGVIEIIHSVSKRGVRIESIEGKNWKRYWSKKFLFARSIINDSKTMLADNIN